MIIFLNSTNQIIDLWCCRNRSRPRFLNSLILLISDRSNQPRTVTVVNNARAGRAERAECTKRVGRAELLVMQIKYIVQKHSSGLCHRCCSCEDLNFLILSTQGWRKISESFSQVPWTHKRLYNGLVHSLAKGCFDSCCRLFLV